MIKFIQIYLIIINIAGLMAMVIDKKKAIQRERRISEKTLFILALMGGALGGMIGMKMVRHKTQTFKFTFSFPMILIAQFGLLYFVSLYLL